VFEIPIDDGPTEVMLIDPATRQTAGTWRFAGGGRTLQVDFTGDRDTMCRVDGRSAQTAELMDDFIAWPRMTFQVNGKSVELIARDREVLRRHYARPHHQEVSYAPTPDPYVEAFHQARVAQARRLLRGVRGRVLDVGSGYSLVMMAGPWKFQLFACDLDADAVRMMTEQRRATAVVASVEAVPFAAGTFDAVFAGEIVEHLLEPDTALEQWIQVLRPGGRLVLTTPNRLHLTARLLHRYEPKNPEHLFEYSRRELVSAVERAGARVEHVEGLQLPLPVYIPTKGWRDAVAGVRRRWAMPPRLYAMTLRAGRHLPSFSENLALVAARR
jgi:SAM-dependent methyltransferase